MTRSQEFIASVHPALDTDPQLERVMALAPTVNAWLQIDDSKLILVLDNQAPLKFILNSITIGELVSELPGDLGASLVSAEWGGVLAIGLAPESGMALISGATAYLSAYTSVLWRLARPISSELDAMSELLNGLGKQADIRQATGAWLDLWGLVWDCPRLPGEADPAYRRRIIYSLTTPRANNVALEMLIYNAFGKSATVADDSSSLMTLNGTNTTLDTWGPGAGGGWGPPVYGAFTVTMDDPDVPVEQLVALIQRYKAAGVSFTLNTRYTPEARLLFVHLQVVTEPDMSDAVLVVPAGIAFARALKAQESTIYLAIGTGDPAWDAQNPKPQPPTTQQTLLNEVARVLATVEYLTEQGAVSPTPTNRLRLSATFGAGVANGQTIRELAAFSFGSGGVGSGTMLAARNIPAFAKGAFSWDRAMQLTLLG